MGFWDFLSGPTPQDREFQESREGWEEAERLLRHSPIGEHGVGGLALLLMGDLLTLKGRLPKASIFTAMFEATADLLDLEEIGVIEPQWDLVKTDMQAGVDFRKMVARRKRWALTFDARHRLVRTHLLPLWKAIVEALPEHCFAEYGEEGTLFEVPLIELIDRPGELVEHCTLFPSAEALTREGMFERLRLALYRNVRVASGLHPTPAQGETRPRLVLPSKQEGLAPATLVSRYLGRTPFAPLFEAPAPFTVAEETRFEHCHIVGGTGHGKTQLMQRMIHADLVAAVESKRSVIVIDSQGDLIAKLVRLELFSQEGGLTDRLILIDPADIEFPAALNLFATNLERLGEYTAADRERVQNGVIELYETFFGALLGAELTQKQGVIFKYLARLMIAIPGATIHTLMQLMTDGKPFREEMKKLDGSARYFFETEFLHPSFAATKKQILRRLWGVLATPAFERMFAQRENKLDLFQAMQDGKIILVNTAKDLLKKEGSELFGRFFLAMLEQAALERSTIPADERTPTFVYVDEAQEYFDDTVEAILNQARKYKVGLTVAHQTLDQLSSRLRAVLHANTSMKCAGGLSARDARAFAEELHTTSDFIESMRRRDGRTEFAVWIRQQVPHAIRLAVPLGHLERQSTLTEEAYDALIDRNRKRYCGTLAAVTGFDWSTLEEPPVKPAPRIAPNPQPTAAPEPTQEVRSQPEPELREPPRTQHAEEPSQPRPVEPAARVQAPRATPEQGKGGKHHRYLQQLVKDLGEQQGFRCSIEAPQPGGGQIDVLLERDGVSVPVEVCVTTPLDWELANIRKTLRAGYQKLALVVAKAGRAPARFRDAIAQSLEPADRERVVVLLPEDIADFIATLGPPPETTESVIRGYKVRVSHRNVSVEEARLRRETLNKIVAQSLKRHAD